MKLVRGIYMRGGTSKGVYFHAKDLPADPALRDRIILDIYGSPDLTEIDGLGGANVLTSKTAIIARSARADADVDYTFGQVMINEPLVDYRINCGNISAGVGPFAIDEGLVPAVEPLTRVRIFNTNTQRVIIAEVPVKDGRAAVVGDYHIDGVPGTGARILLDFAATGGTLGKGLLPTGHACETLSIDGLGTFDVSIVDAANPSVFVKGTDLGLQGTEPFQDILNNQSVWDTADRIRGSVGVRLGMYPDLDSFLRINPTMPFCILVFPPIGYTDFVDGRAIAPDSYDIKGIIRFAGAVHRAYSGTGSVCTAVAAQIDGTIANAVCAEAARSAAVVRIGHPSGIMDVDIRVERDGEEYRILRAAYGRTARRIMEGYIYLKPWADDSSILSL
ncbi:2-methylaconitate cis-trans isomerase PrpF family protein [uncultured Lamprocystis sp.]|jgi:2-methylaconitate cis-trans-isomerase PrpF|uniref:2-methylaconitate cis-trans isomerase PrpF family protein n=1 Tax=uncultured Lamprocystis sp. TaxID=543132 RepID=UPI0025F3EE2D|nr:PrpF domain-containing protein [uncultured Lamprocystis sp.]